MRWFMLLFVLMPLAELLLLFEVADRLGGWSTLLLVIFAAVAGVQILRWQGLTTLSQVTQRLNSGQLPAQEIIEALLLSVAGALLITPGFITDSLGFTLLVRPVRSRLARKLMTRHWLYPGNAWGQRNDPYGDSTSGEIIDVDPDSEIGNRPSRRVESGH